MKVYFGVLIFLSAHVFGQAPDSLWTYIYRGNNDQYDCGKEVILLNDSSYMVIGSTAKFSNSTSNQDYVLLNISPAGNIIQEKYFDFGGDDNGVSISFNETEKIYSFAGYSNSHSSGDYNIYVNKLDSSKNILWEKYLGGSANDYCTSHQELADGFIVAGYTYSYGIGACDFYLIRLDKDGDTLWTKTYGGKEKDHCNSVHQTSDGGFILTGSTNSFGYGKTDIWTIKTDENGDTLWTVIFGTVNDDQGYYVDELSDGTYAITGIYNQHYDSESAGYDVSKIIFLRIDSDGGILDSSLYGPELSLNYGSSFQELNDKSIIITGSVLGNGSNGGTVNILKIDFAGNEVWSKNVQIGNAWDDYGNSIIQDYSGCYVITGAGRTNRDLDSRDLFVLKIETDKLTAKFSNDFTSGRIPLTLHFTDSSSINTTSWQWDFDNDGIIDSEEQNPTWTYFDADTYSVKLVVSNGIQSDTLLKEDYVIAYFDTFPNLYLIEDVLNDQGGWVKVRFAKSTYDTDSLILAKSASPELYTVEIYDDFVWTAAASTVACGKSIYSVLVPTTKDSSTVDDGLIGFRVIAGMSEGNFASYIMTGYSVDNLHPSIPLDLTGKITQDGNVKLTWLAVPDKDFKYYQIYRSTNETSDELIDSSTDTVYIDDTVVANHSYYYSVKAVDNSGNESAFSNTASVYVTGIIKENGLPIQYYLSQNYPNPFNPRTYIKYGLLSSGKVKITIFDVQGHKVNELLNETQNQGHHQVVWDGKNDSGQIVGTGIYYYSIESRSFKFVKKMLFIK